MVYGSGRTGRASLRQDAGGIVVGMVIGGGFISFFVFYEGTLCTQ